MAKRQMRAGEGESGVVSGQSGWGEGGVESGVCDEWRG